MLPVKFKNIANRLLTASCGAIYIGVIDGGAACERVAGIDASEFVFGVCLAGFAGCVVVFPVWPCAGLGRFGVVLDRLRCLTIASEERETWAAGSLRPGASRARCSDALRENCTDGHVSRFIASAFWVDGCVWDSSRRLGLGLTFGLVEIVISRVWVFELSTT